MRDLFKQKLSKQDCQAIVLYISTMLGVLLGVVSSVINTHALPPNDYGDVRYVQNIISFIASLLLFGYFLSGSRLLALSDNISYNRRVKGIMVVILALSAVILMAALAITGLFHVSQPAIKRLLIISLPVSIYPLLLNYVNTTAQGDNQIGRLSLARFLPMLLYVIVAYALYRCVEVSSQLMVLLQWGIYSIVLISIVFSTKPKFSNLKPVWNDLRRENKEYGLQLYIGSLVMVATNYLAGISLGAFNSDNVEVGYYTLALTVTSPLSTLPAIIGTTYFKKFATLPSIPNSVIKYTTFITLLSCISFILLIKPVVIFLYTEEYAPVGTYASLLSVGFCIHGIGDMINRYLGSHGQGKAIRNCSVFNGVIKIIGYTILVYIFNTKGAIATTIICDLIYLISLIYYYRMFISSKVSL